ncbi:MAG: 5-(carboxyamino)imidazole ribonucleotide mutase [Thermoanaerobaculia bacterium]
MKRSERPLIGIVMGSDSDWPTMQPAAEVCADFGLEAEVRVLSAHRTPEDMMRYARSAAGRGLRVVIAGAGGAAHLPGMVASLTPLPVIGVPVESSTLKGLDSLLSIVQMPGGVPVATVAIGGGRNAGILAVQILGASDAGVRRRVAAFKARLARESRAKGKRLQDALSQSSGTRSRPPHR